MKKWRGKTFRALSLWLSIWYLYNCSKWRKHVSDRPACSSRKNQLWKSIKSPKRRKNNRNWFTFSNKCRAFTKWLLAFKEKEEIFKELGFNFEEFGINTIIVKSHPTWLITGYEEEQIRKIIDFLISTPTTFERAKFQDHLAATAACKMSVKGNEATTTEQAENLLNDLVKCDNPYNCPHGRPTIISFTRYELERMFKRVMN